MTPARNTRFSPAMRPDQRKYDGDEGKLSDLHPDIEKSNAIGSVAFEIPRVVNADAL